MRTRLIAHDLQFWNYTSTRADKNQRRKQRHKFGPSGKGKKEDLIQEEQKV